MKHPFLIFLLFLCGGFSAVAQPSGNPLVFRENRLTLITPTLFRLEVAHDGKFFDDPTYFAYDRGSLLPASEFRVRELGGNHALDKENAAREAAGQPTKPTKFETDKAKMCIRDSTESAKGNV